jgi:AraC-like DNA-binding protein
MAENLSVRYASLPGYSGVEVCEGRFAGPLAPAMIWPGLGVWSVVRGANDAWCARRQHWVGEDRPLVIQPGEVVRATKRYGATTQDVTVSIFPDALDSLLRERAAAAHTLGRRSGRGLKRATEAVVRAGFSGRPLDCAWLLEQLIDRLLDRDVDRRGDLAKAPSPALLRARDYLHAHFNRTVTIAELVTASELSRYYIIKGFRRAFGVPPHQYQNLLRIEHARRLIHKGMRLTDVAFETGYTDPSHFAHRFRQFVHCSPSQYRTSIFQPS